MMWKVEGCSEVHYSNDITVVLWGGKCDGVHKVQNHTCIVVG